MLDPNQSSPLPGPSGDGQPVVAPQGGPILLTPQDGAADANAPFTLAVDHAGTDAVARPPARRPRRRWVGALLAGAVTLVVLAGAVAAKLWYRSSGALPEGAVPASTAAFVRINLSPGYGQRAKMLALLKKFPAGGGTAGTAGSNRFDTYKRSLLAGLDLGVSYDDAKDWLGDRAGIGAWADSYGHPVMLAVFASVDDAKARKALGAARDRTGSEHLGFVVSGGYALVAQADNGAQTAADEAARAAGKFSLADSDAFRAAVSTLPADQPLLAWTDLAHVGEFVTAAVDEAGRHTGEPVPDLNARTPGLSKLTGQIVAGGQAVDNGIEVRLRAIGLAMPAGVTIDAKAALAAMPGNAAFAAAAGGVDGTGGGTANLGPLGDLLSSGLIGLPGFGARGPATAPGADPGTAPSVGPDGKLHLTGPDGKDLVIDPQDPSTFPATPTDPAVGGVAGGDTSFGQAWQAIGAALGAARSIQLTLAGTPAADQALPPMMATVNMADSAAATSLAGDVTTLASTGAFGRPGALTVSRHDNTVQVRAADYAPADGTLADSALFGEAMAGAPEALTGAAYVDVGKIATVLGASGAAATELGPVKAVGVTTARSGEDGVALIRVVIR